MVNQTMSMNNKR